MPVFYHCIVLIFFMYSIICQRLFILFFEYQVILNIVIAMELLLWPFSLNILHTHDYLADTSAYHPYQSTNTQMTHTNISNRNILITDTYIKKPPPNLSIIYCTTELGNRIRSRSASRSLFCRVTVCGTELYKQIVIHSSR